MRFLRFGAIALEFALLIAASVFFSRWFYLGLIFRALSVVLCVVVLNTEMNDAYKALYVLLLCMFPLFGTIVCGVMQLGKWRAARRSRRTDEEYSKTGNYLASQFGAEAYAAENIRYFDNGREFFEALIADIDKAKRFVFLQFYIVKAGVLQKKLFSAMKNAVARGAEVRLLYDGFGSGGFEKEIKAFAAETGVTCRCFNKIGLFFKGGVNNRNHSKSAVIDGVKGYVGGVNVGDEYFGEDLRCGIWKDGGMSYEGRAVNALTEGFFTAYDFGRRKKERYERYLNRAKPAADGGELRTFVSAPTRGVSRLAEVYKTLVYNAKKSVVVSTPYLIPDDGVSSALAAAAARGVEVSVVIPGIPDKKTVYAVTLSVAEKLKKRGVNVLKYKKGFIHAKNTAVDGRYAVCGSGNLDYRSMYLHFETGVFVKSAKLAKMVERDILKDAAPYEEKAAGVKGKLLKVFAPMM